MVIAVVLARARGRPGAGGDPGGVRLRRAGARRSSRRRWASAESFPERVAAAASPIDDVRGTAAYRRHALKVLTARALERVLT